MIRIMGEGFGDWLQIVIEDNGGGMETEQATAIEEILGGKRDMFLESQKSTGIGSRNVVARMYMFYGEELDIKMSTAVGKGTVFTFRIPLPGREEGEAI